jgi:hypothetical protein
MPSLRLEYAWAFDDQKKPSGLLIQIRFSVLKRDMAVLST